MARNPALSFLPFLFGKKILGFNKKWGPFPPSSFGGARGNNRASEEAPSASASVAALKFGAKWAARGARNFNISRSEFIYSTWTDGDLINGNLLNKASLRNGVVAFWTSSLSLSLSDIWRENGRARTFKMG